MKSLDKILLPVDFSERSLGAARYAKTLTGRFGSELTLLHVLTPPHYEFGALEIGGSMLTELYANRAEQVDKELETFMAGELTGTKATRVVLEGDPARRIVEYAHEEGIGLVVMPTHGYGPFRQFILGSITAKVLHDSDCPVWTGVHLEEAPQARPMAFQNIVCAVDMGPQSCQALEWATAMQKAFGARLTVVHAMPCSHNATQDDARTAGNGAGGARRSGAHAPQQRDGRGAGGGGRRGAQGSLRAGPAGESGIAGDRAGFGGRGVWAAAYQRLCHHPAVAVSGGQRLRVAS